MADNDMKKIDTKSMNVFERYLTLWGKKRCPEKTVSGTFSTRPQLPLSGIFIRPRQTHRRLHTHRSVTAIA